jgi:hypothetical protein
MNFLSIDLHIAVNADIRNIFNQLGHTVEEISMGGHPSVIGRPAGNIPMLKGDNWCSTIQERKHEEFYNKYKEQFKKYDGFICCYPPIFSMLYKNFEKPIIIQIPIRYECGADNNPELWQEFNEYLRNGIDNGQIFISANNIYDQKYASGFINREVNYIPSLCSYTGMSYNPVNELFLYYSSFNVNDESGRMIKKHSAMSGGHAWQNIADYKGCIHYPYNVSTMSIFEQYTANIPLFFPSMRYLLEMWLSRTPILDQISWQQQQGERAKSFSLIPHNFKYDPNNFTDYDSVRYWLKYADYYCENMKCIQYFDSVEERDMILSFDQKALLDISEQMKEHNKEREYFIIKKWENVLRVIKGEKVMFK